MRNKDCQRWFLWLYVAVNAPNCNILNAENVWKRYINAYRKSFNSCFCINEWRNFEHIFGREFWDTHWLLNEAFLSLVHWKHRIWRWKTTTKILNSPPSSLHLFHSSRMYEISTSGLNIIKNMSSNSSFYFLNDFLQFYSFSCYSNYLI